MQHSGIILERALRAPDEWSESYLFSFFSSRLYKQWKSAGARWRGRRRKRMPLINIRRGLMRMSLIACVRACIIIRLCVYNNFLFVMVHVRWYMCDVTCGSHGKFQMEDV